MGLNMDGGSRAATQSVPVAVVTNREGARTHTHGGFEGNTE